MEALLPAGAGLDAAGVGVHNLHIAIPHNVLLVAAEA